MLSPSNKLTKILSSVALLALFSGSLLANTISLSPSADGYIRATQSAQQSRNTSNDLYIVGNTSQRGDAFRGVLSFSLSDPELKGAKILSAKLVMQIQARDSSGGGSASVIKEIGVYPLTRDIDEASVDWLRNKSGSPWNRPGGDFGACLTLTEANPAAVSAGELVTFSGDALAQSVESSLGGSMNLLVKVESEDTARCVFRFQSGAARLILEFAPSKEGAAAAAKANAWKQAPAGSPQMPGAGVNPIPGHLTEPISRIFAVVADGNPIEVKSNRFDFEVAMFSLVDGPVQVDVMVNQEFDTYTLKPTRHDIPVERHGNALSFTLSDPLKLVLQIPGIRPLAIIVTPGENDVPVASDSNVIYFGPGLTNAGAIRPQSGQTVYLAPGALVRGRIEAVGVQNVRIMGRGILDVTGYSSQENRKHGILVQDCENVIVEGIGIRSVNGWWQTLFINSKDIKVSQMNLFGVGVNTDGFDIDAVKNFHASDSFIRCEDDGLGWHSLDAETYGEMITENAIADNLVIWNTAAGNGIRIGASMEGQLWRNIIIQNIDILQHAGAGIYSDYSDWAWAENLKFINIAIEKPSSPINFYIAKTRYTNATGYMDRRGNIDRLLFENITMTGGSIRLNGYDAEHQISHVRFNNCVLGGVPVDSLSMVRCNAYVSDVAFNEPLPGVDLPVAGKLDLPALESRSVGAPQYIARVSGAYQGRTRVLLADGPGDEVIQVIPFAEPGKYRLLLTIRTSPSGGKADLYWNDKKLLEGVDFYAAMPDLKTVDCGEVNLVNMVDQELKFSVSGKVSQSAGYLLELDSLAIEPMYVERS